MASVHYTYEMMQKIHVKEKALETLTKLTQAGRKLADTGSEYPYAHDMSVNYGDRYALAKEAVKIAMADFKVDNDGNYKAGTYKVFEPALKSKGKLKMGNIATYIEQVVGSEQTAIINQFSEINQPVNVITGVK